MGDNRWLELGVVVMLSLVGCGDDATDPAGEDTGGKASTSTGDDDTMDRDDGVDSSGDASGDSSGSSSGSSGGSSGDESGDSSGDSSGTDSGEPCATPDGVPFDYYAATVAAIDDLANVLTVGDIDGTWEYAYLLGPMCPFDPPEPPTAGVEPVCAVDFDGCPEPESGLGHPACIGGLCNLFCPDGSCPEGMLCRSGNYNMPQCVVQTIGDRDDLPPFTLDPYQGLCWPTEAGPADADVCVTSSDGPCPIATLATYTCAVDDDCPASSFGSTVCDDGHCGLACDGPSEDACPAGMQCGVPVDGGPGRCARVTFEQCG